MNEAKRTRGAVSVFLVMILVPCIVVTSVFVDLGRVHMSKSMADSAGDLALNSLMTNYDADLNEWYGMVASCQNIDEFYDISAQFFLRTISSRGLSDDEIYLLSDYYSNATNDDSIIDLLQTECQTAPSAMIKPVNGEVLSEIRGKAVDGTFSSGNNSTDVEDANLTNATLLKDQVVEFMKYRAPIELTTSIIEGLKSDKSITQMTESNDNQKLVDDKTAHYEAEGELLAAAFNTYCAVSDYHEDAEENHLTFDKLKQYASKITSFKTLYSQIHALTVSNLFNTDGLKEYDRVTLGLNTYNNSYTEKSKDVYSSKKTVDGSVHYIINKSKINTLLNNLEQKIADFNAAKTKFETASNSLMSNLPGTAKNKPNTIQWWVNMNAAVNAAKGTNHTSKMRSTGQDMLKAYSKVLAINKCEFDSNVSSDWEERYNTLTGLVKDIQIKYLKAGVKDSKDKYLIAVNKLEEISAANLKSIKASSLSISVDGENRTVEYAIKYVKSELEKIRNELQRWIDELTIAIDGNESDKKVKDNDKVKSLDQLLALAEKYSSSLETWEDTANVANTPETGMAEEHKSEIAKIKQISQNINKKSVGILKTRLTNIKTLLNSIVEAIESIKYGKSKVIDIGSFSTFKDAAKAKVSSSGIKLLNKDITNYSNNTFSQLFSPNVSSFFTLKHTDENNYNPVINPDTKQVDTPELFIYFKEKYGAVSKNDLKERIDNKRSELDDGEGIGEEKEKNASEGRYNGVGEEIEKDFSGSKTFNLADGAISSIVDFYESLINLDIRSIRDDLYATAYIMNMFSYATYENEGLYSLIEDKTSLNLSNYSTKYKDVMGSAETEKSWQSTSLKDSYNKSLTNKLINEKNNAAYCAEIEYILYGGRNNKKNTNNVSSVYSNIYVLRYALNLISGFANFWTPKNATATAINEIAFTIQTFTCGIIPIPITKLVLIPILTIFETSKDLDRLQAGFPVELYKSTYEDWWISVPGVDSIGSFTSGLSKGFDGPNKDKGIFYSDYITVFVYLGLKSSAKEAMYQRMAEVIQTNMGKLTSCETYSMKRSWIYFKLEATIRVKPLMITLPYFNDYSNNMSTKTDWCTYTTSIVRGYS